jgi:hypothetical protein
MDGECSPCDNLAGQRVRVKWSQGLISGIYDGTVSASKGDGWSVKFDDGDKKVYSSEYLLKHVITDDTCSLSFDDDEQVTSSCSSNSSNTSARGTCRSAASETLAGQRVRVKWSQGLISGMYDGTVSASKGDGWSVKFDDGDEKVYSSEYLLKHVITDDDDNMALSTDSYKGSSGSRRKRKRNGVTRFVAGPALTVSRIASDPRQGISRTLAGERFPTLHRQCSSVMTAVGRIQTGDRMFVCWTEGQGHDGRYYSATVTAISLTSLTLRYDETVTVKFSHSESPPRSTISSDQAVLRDSYSYTSYRLSQ